MGFHEVPWNSMRFYDVLVNRSVPTEANRGLTSYRLSLLNHLVYAQLRLAHLSALTNNLASALGSCEGSVKGSGDLRSELRV
jgi:hypothetical protein